MKADTQAVLFDLDGTLYDQPKLRRRMAVELLAYYLPRPHRWREVLWLQRFRRRREKIIAPADQSLDEYQYRAVADELGIASAELKRIATAWLQERPLPHLKKRKHSLADEVWFRLKAQQIKIGVVSDYPAADKLTALGLRADTVVCSTDNGVNAFKPDPAGYLKAAQLLDIPPQDCLVVGDRPDLDGAAAQQAGMSYLTDLRQLKAELNYAD